MNVKINLKLSDEEKTYRKAERIMLKLLTKDERQTIADVEKQHFKNLTAAIYWVLYSKFGFTAEQIKTFADEFNENFEDIDTHPAYFANDIPQKAELEAALGITITDGLEIELLGEE